MRVAFLPQPARGLEGVQLTLRTKLAGRIGQHEPPIQHWVEHNDSIRDEWSKQRGCAVVTRRYVQLRKDDVLRLCERRTDPLSNLCNRGVSVPNKNFDGNAHHKVELVLSNDFSTHIDRNTSIANDGHHTHAPNVYVGMFV